jgi:DNA polymerase delta subunit 2
LVFISGLELASNPPNLALNLFTEWLGGLLGNAKVQDDEASIVRLIIAGNSIKGIADHHVSKGHASGKAEDAAAAKDLANGIKRFDLFLELVGSNCCVTVLPGQFDTTTLMMPQRAMHPGLFTNAKRFYNILIIKIK